MVRLIHHNHVRLVFDALQAFDPFAATLQIGVIDDHQVGKDAKQLRQIRAQRRFPDRLAPRFWNDEQHFFALKLHQTFNQHQPHECLAKAHAITQKGATKLTAYFQQCAVAISLVLVEDGVHPRVVALPITGCLFVVAEILLQRFGVHLKWQVFTGVPFDDLEHIGRNVFGLIPMRLVPLLQFFDLSTQLDIEFNVARQARKSKVAGTNQRRRAHHGQLGVGDVCLGVELLFGVNPTLDFPAGNGLHDGRNTRQKIIFGFFALNAVVELAGDTGNAFCKRAVGSFGDFVAHEDANLVELLPLPVQRQQGAYLKVARGNVEPRGDFRPFGEVAEHLPFVIAVVNDKKIIARFIAHSVTSPLAASYQRIISS